MQSSTQRFQIPRSLQIFLAAALLVPALNDNLSLAADQAADDEAKIAALPEAVRAGVARAVRVYKDPLREAKWTKVTRLGETDHALYQLQGKNARGNKVEMEITSAGRVIEVEEVGIPMDEVPEAVIKALKEKLPDFKPKKIEAIYQVEKNQPVCYGFEGKGADGKEVEQYISADGKSYLN